MTRIDFYFYFFFFKETFLLIAGARGCVAEAERQRWGVRASQRAVAFLSLCVNGAASGETERAQRADRAAELSVPLTRVKGAGAELTHTAPPVQPLPPRLCAPSDADLDTGDGPRVVAVLLLLFFSSFSFFFWFDPSARSSCAGTRGGGEAALVSPLSLPWT